MSDVEKAALDFIRSEEFRVQCWPKHSDSFLAGAAWQREVDAKLAESHFGSEPISVDTRRIHNNDTALSIAKLIRATAFDIAKDSNEKP